MKKVRTDNGALLKLPPTEFLQWVTLIAVLPPAVLQFVLKFLTVHDLVQLDTAMHSHALIATLESVYTFGLGLESNALSNRKYSRVLDLRWVFSRGIFLQHFELELPPAERSHFRRKGLTQKASSNVFPTFHWLLWYHMQLTSETDRFRDIVRLIAACGSSNQLELCDSNGWSALTIACDLGDAEVVRLLVGRGDLCMGPGAVDSDGSQATPLERAIRSNSYACVQALVSGGAAVTPEALHLAIQRFGAKRLIEAPPPTNPDHETFLRERQRAMFPSRCVPLDSMQQLLLQAPERKQENREKESADNGVEIVRCLAQSDCGILAVVNSAGRTAIEEAVHLAKPEVADILKKAHEANTADTEDIIAALLGLAFR